MRWIAFLVLGWSLGITFATAKISEWLKDYQTLIGVFVAVAIAVAAWVGVKQQSLITLMLHEKQRMEADLPGMKQIATLLNILDLTVGNLIKGADIKAALHPFQFWNGVDQALTQLHAPAASNFDRQRSAEVIRQVLFRADELEKGDIALQVARVNAGLAGGAGVAFLTVGGAEHTQKIAREFMAAATSDLSALHGQLSNDVAAYERRIPQAAVFLGRFFDRL